MGLFISMGIRSVLFLRGVLLEREVDEASMTCFCPWFRKTRRSSGHCFLLALDLPTFVPKRSGLPHIRTFVWRGMKGPAVSNDNDQVSFALGRGRLNICSPLTGML